MDLNNITDAQVIIIDLIIFGIYCSFFIYTKKIKFFLVACLALILGTLIFFINLKGGTVELLYKFMNFKIT